uniref:Pheromone biosynthesis-activating neuropeptide n=1 Tax=Syphacia muris TaxID=451379 RepID=A0A158R4N2_9BILA
MDSPNLHLLTLSVTITVLFLQPTYASLSAVEYTTNQIPLWLNKFNSNDKLLGATSNSGQNFRASEFVAKRSAALGRAHFRPGKRIIDDFNSPEDVDFDRRRHSAAAFSPLRESPMNEYIPINPAYLRMALKRSVTTGRAHFRPAKRIPNCLTSSENDYGY